ncbi:MAG: MASE1 domain-containing protein, partial [Pirellulaceae bacterium]|nr:MASE1 domain-containing protein [Pirellulaceae bacterium]
ANAVEALVGASFLLWNRSEPFSLERLPDTTRLLLVAFFAPLISAAMASSAVVWHYEVNFFSVYFVWWIADCVGILLVAPLTWACLCWQPQGKANWLRTMELVGSFMLTATCTMLIFVNALGELSFPFLLMPLIYWPALRFGTAAVAGNLAVMALIMTIATQQSQGPFADQLSGSTNLAVVLQAFMAATAVPFLALAAMWHERETAAEELERRIQQRTFQLAEADRRKDHFLAVLAHELRNPLAPLAHALEVWPAVHSQPERLHEIREVMTNQVQHMSGLIDDLLDVSRIAGGKILLRKEQLDLRDIVRSSLESSRSQLLAAEHKLTVCLPPTPVYVFGDRARLSQVVSNLLNNAIKYTGRCGHLSVTVQQAGHEALVFVRDNGPGIPQDQLERIFELFTQVDQTLERAHGGLGIGLTLVKNLVELHNGTVRAESTGLGQGSCFCVTLPSCQQPSHIQPSDVTPRVHMSSLHVSSVTLSSENMSSEDMSSEDTSPDNLPPDGLACAHPPSVDLKPNETKIPTESTHPGQADATVSAKSGKSSPKPTLPSHRILVVDDTQASGRMLALLLKSLGQQVEVCFDGPSALSMISSYRPALIFLDIAMPGMSGYEVAVEIKANPATQSIMLVAMTGFGQASDRQRAFDSGFDEHMIKPATLAALTRVVEDLDQRLLPRDPSQ